MSNRRDDEKETGPRDFRVGFLVHDVSRVRRTLFDKEAKPLGMTRSRWWALAQLSRSISKKGVDGMPQTELAEVMDVGKVTVGGLIDHLESAGLVERRPDAKDRRAKRVVITAEGHQVLGEMSEIGKRLNLEILKDISPEDMRVAEDVLWKMRSNILAMLDGHEDLE